jgi:hypothetical protein
VCGSQSRGVLFPPQGEEKKKSQVERERHERASVAASE